MGFFGIGAMEAFVILIVALLIFGPGRLPEIMADAGRTVRDFRRATRDLTGDFQDSVREVRATAEELQTEMQQTANELESDMKRTANDLESGTQVFAESVNESIPTNRRQQQRGTGGATAAKPVESPPSLESEARAAEAKGRQRQPAANSEQPAKPESADQTQSDSVKAAKPARKETSTTASTPSKADPLADLAGLDEDLLSPNGSSEAKDTASQNGKRGQSKS